MKRMTVVKQGDELFLQGGGAMYALVPGTVFNVEPEFSDELVMQRLREWIEEGRLVVSVSPSKGGLGL